MTCSGHTAGLSNWWKRPDGWGVWHRDQKAKSMTTIKAMRLASLVTAINVLVASGFSIAAIFRPEAVVPAGSIPTEAALLLAMYAAARTIPLALFALAANLQTIDVCVADLGHARGRRAIAGCRNRPVSARSGEIRWAALYCRPPILRGVSASQIRADYAANHALMNAR